jgi:glutathione synthase/RimK-type ligase-like ATP-grasp enzyme
MAKNALILILTNRLDISADYVVRVLRQRNAQMMRLNTETMPFNPVSMQIPRSTVTVMSKDKRYELMSTLKSVWLRRPGRPFDSNENRLSSTTVYIQNQWKAFIESLTCVESAFWINAPESNRKAELKVRQLMTAEALGLRIPKTCITSNKEELQEFYKQFDGNIIAKALDAPLIEGEQKDYFIFTQKMPSLDNVTNEEIALTPVIFQERIFPKIDYRITVIGNDYFSVKISDPKQQLDWRAAKEGVEFSTTEISREIGDKCVKLVRKLGLTFGAIDIVESNGQFFFLEVNPNGEWGWLQKKAGVPIAEKIADYLIAGEVAN